MKIKSRAIVRYCCGIAAFMALFSACQSIRTGEPISANANEQLYGYLYNSDGTPAISARVSLVPSNSIPTTSLLKTAHAKTAADAQPIASAATSDGITDKNGRYSFAYVPTDTYNVYGEGKGTVSYHAFVAISSDKKNILIASDTLNLPGSIKGTVITKPPSDYRKIFILVKGGYVVRWPEDSAGRFTIPTMAQGKYQIRFLSVDQNIPVFDTTVSVFPGKETDMGTITLGGNNSNQLNQATIDSIKASKAFDKQDYLGLKFGVLIHFNMSTFSNDTDSYSEDALPNIDEKVFNPTSLDCGQWADGVKAAGAKYIVLTVKHNDGFCLWNSHATEHDVGRCLWGQGTRDIAREFVDSSRARGLQIGFYFSTADIRDAAALSAAKSELSELLSNYGEITCLYLNDNGYSTSVFPYGEEIYSFVYSLQKKCIVIEDQNHYSEQNTDIVGFYKLENTGYDKDYTTLLDWDAPPYLGLKGVSCEAIESIHPWYWFWHVNLYPNGDTDSLGPHTSNCDILVPKRIVDRLNACNALKENYVLSVCPDTTGLLPQCQVECLQTVGTLRGK